MKIEKLKTREYSFDRAYNLGDVGDKINEIIDYINLLESTCAQMRKEFAKSNA